MQEIIKSGGVGPSWLLFITCEDCGRIEVVRLRGFEPAEAEQVAAILDLAVNPRAERCQGCGGAPMISIAREERRG